MTEQGGQVLEFGRYRVLETPDGGWVLLRTSDTCERCQSCGCGQKQDYVRVAGGLVRAAQAMQKAGGLSPLGMLRRLGNGRGDDSEGSGGGAQAAESGGDPGGAVGAVPDLGLSDQKGRGRAGRRGPAAAGTAGPGPV